MKPDIEKCDKGRKGEPLKCVAVVPFDPQRRRRPIALQSFGSRPGLLQRKIGAKRQPGFDAKGFKVEILPDRIRPFGCRHGSSGNRWRGDSRCGAGSG